MKINYGTIVTNALSTLVATVFIGAAAIVWKGVTSVDTRIGEAKDEILFQQSGIEATQKTILPQVANIEASVEDLKAEVRSLSKLLADANALPAEISYKEGEAIVLKEFTPKRVPDWSTMEAARLKEEIDVRQQKIYKQALKK